MNRIAYVTDLHLGEQFPINLGIDARSNWNEILDDIKYRGIDEIVIGGDLGNTDTNAWFFETLSDIDYTLTAGNHDITEEIANYFTPPAGSQRVGLNYSYDTGGFRRIYLDSSSEAVTDEQSAMLKDSLDTVLPVLLFIHHPVFPVASPIDRKHYLRDREMLQELLLDSDKEVFIFCGHYHMEDEQTIDNVTQIITPAVSYQVLKNADPMAVSSDSFAYRIISLDDEQISSEIITFEDQ